MPHLITDEDLRDLRARADRTRRQLEVLWGEGMPPGPDPIASLLVDALAFDDQLGRERGLVTQGDRVPREGAGAPAAALGRLRRAIGRTARGAGAAGPDRP